MHGAKRGVFISFEGVEGSGKTTQAEALVKWLTERNISHIYIRDPGCTQIGEKIREILLSKEFRNMHAHCEVLLFLAARSQLTYEKILPALGEKKVVVTDRFSDSTFAYQCYARDLPRRMIAIFNRFATAGIKPDLTFLVDVDTAVRKERGKFEDRMETEAEVYHQRVRQAYKLLAARSKKRFRVLDGEKPVNVIQDEVISHIRELLIRKGYRV
jgi:dTMP kinase